MIRAPISSDTIAGSRPVVPPRTPSAPLGLCKANDHLHPSRSLPQTASHALIHTRPSSVSPSIHNDASETIGTIDDLLVTRDGKEPYAVLSIGGFLGMGTHLVVIRYDSLTFLDNKIVLPGGTKDGLRMLPTFTYAKE
jgi:hypothetical protein